MKTRYEEWELYVTDRWLSDAAGHYPRIGKGKVRTLINGAVEITPAEARNLGAPVADKDRCFIFKEYKGVTAVTRHERPEVGKHPNAAVAYHPLPADRVIPAMTRHPWPR